MYRWNSSTLRNRLLLHQWLFIHLTRSDVPSPLKTKHSLLEAYYAQSFQQWQQIRGSTKLLFHAIEMVWAAPEP